MTKPGSGQETAEDKLRAALGAVAAEVRVDRPSFGRMSGSWRQRYRRRRIVLMAVAVLVFFGADAIGVVVLNSSDQQSQVMFSGPGDPGGHGAPMPRWP